MRAGGDAGLAEHQQFAAIVERLLNRVQFAIERIERVELLSPERDTVLALVVLLEDESAEVSQRDLATAAQVLHAAAQRHPLKETGCPLRVAR